jgi:predicted transcriptional regulator
LAKAVAKRDAVSVGLDAMQNPTKLQIIFLLMKHPKLTVTQMSKDIGVSKANLYHFAAQMVSDGLLSEPEVIVKGNYVEKYYKLKWGALESINAVEQRIKSFKPEAQREILQTFVASATLVSRKAADELGRADKKALAKIHSAYKKDMINTTYLLLPDEVYAEAVKRLNKVVKEILEIYERKKGLSGENRILILGVPQLEDMPRK